MPPLLNRAKDLKYHKMYASFLPLKSNIHPKAVRIVTLPGLLQHSTSKTNKKHTSFLALNHAIQYCNWMHMNHRNWLNNEIWSMCMLPPLFEKYPNEEFFLSVFSRIWTHFTQCADAAATCKLDQTVWRNQVKFKNGIIHLGNFHAVQELFGIFRKIVTGSKFDDVFYKT